MRNAYRPLLGLRNVIGLVVVAPLLPLLAGGCSAESAAFVGDREVSAQTSSLNGTSVCGDGKSAQFVLGLRAFDVNERQISWAPGHVLELPESWTKLELVQSGKFVIVRVDGKDFHKIDPAA
jgi:hypothetical protein